MRCVIALMQHETNTFSPLPTPLHAFASGVGLDHPPSGQQAIGIYGSADFAFAAMVDAAVRRGAEVSIPVAAYAEPSGKVEDSAFESIADSICADVAKGCDAVLLDLHGAMVTQSFDDGEGELLKRIRRIDPSVPIGVALDFHTNLSEQMATNCNVMDGYRTYPHVDMYQTGQRVARSLFRIIDSRLSTRLSWRSLPMLTHMINQTPLRQPMKDIMDLAINSADSGSVMNASVFGGFPLADIPHASFSTVVVESAASKFGESLVDDICDMAWRRRGDFVFDPEPFNQSITRAKQFTQFPVVIADHGDNCGAGGSADDMSVLEEMLGQGLTHIVAGPFWDPEAVAAMMDAGVGAEVSLTVGGKTHAPAIHQRGHSLQVSGRVSKFTDGRFRITGPMQTGLEVNLGKTAVLKTPALELMLCEQRWEPYDAGCFTHAGIDLAEKHYILIKSRQHFRAGFESIASHIVLAAGPGVCNSDYQQYSFRNLNRPIFPLDPDMPRPAHYCNSFVIGAN